MLNLSQLILSNKPLGKGNFGMYPYFQQNCVWVIKTIGFPNTQTKRPIIFNLEALLLKPQSISIWAIWLNMFSGNQNLRNLDAEEIVE